RANFGDLPLGEGQPKGDRPARKEADRGASERDCGQGSRQERRDRRAPQPPAADCADEPMGEGARKNERQKEGAGPGAAQWHGGGQEKYGDQGGESRRVEEFAAMPAPAVVPCKP